MLRILAFMVLSMVVGWPAAGQSGSTKYQIGLRSHVVVGTMSLSGISTTFDDLSTDGITGAHASSLYFMVRIKSYLRVGWEQLVGNADEGARTTMDFQGGGPVAEVSFGRRWIVAGGLQVGGLIANAMRRTDEADRPLHEGTYFKGTGFFAAPYAGAGRRLGALDLRVIVKHMAVSGTINSEGMQHFSSTYAGVNIGYNF